MSELMATMVTKSCKRKALATATHPDGSTLPSTLPPSEEIDGAVSAPFGEFRPVNFADIYGFDGEYVSVVDVSENQIVNLNGSNNIKVRAGNAETTVRNGTLVQYNSEYHESTHFSPNQRLAPMSSNNNLGRGGVTNKQKNVNDDKLSNIFDCGKDFNKSLHPEIANVKIGATEFMSTLGMRPLACPLGYVEHHLGSELSLSFVLSISCLITANFIWRSKVTQNCNEYVFQILRKQQLTFRLRFPYEGFYTLEVYAQRKLVGELPKSVFNYIIRVPDPVGQNVLPFPKAHKDWHMAGFVLKEPMTGILPSNSHSKFALKVLRALSVFATSGGVSVDLEERGGSWWIGQVNTGGAGSEIVLHAVFTTKSHSPVPLLSFHVAPTPDGKTKKVEISAFEIEIIAIEKKRLEQLLNSNREWLENVLEEEVKMSNDTISAHTARLLKLSRKQSMKMEHTKVWHKFKPTQQKANLRELLKREQKILENLRNSYEQRLKDIRKVESETIASIEAGGKNAIQEIMKSLDDLLHRTSIPEEKVAARVKGHMQLMSELEIIQKELFSKSTWMEESLNEIYNVHAKTVTAVADLQNSTLASLGLVVKTPKDQDRGVKREMTEREILNQLENMEKAQLMEMTNDAKAYVDGTSDMKHASIKQIYTLQIDEMQLEDKWIKDHEMQIFELQQIGSPPSEIAYFLQTEIAEATDDCRNRLGKLREELLQQSQYLQDVYKEKLSQFRQSVQNKLEDYETKLETKLATSCEANKNLRLQLSSKPRESVLRLENYLGALVQEIDARDLSTFLAIREAIANNVVADLEQAQTDMLENMTHVISIDKTGKQIVNRDIMQHLVSINRASWKQANGVLTSDFAIETGRLTKESPEAVLARVQETRRLPETRELLHRSSTEESEGEDVDERPLSVGGSVTDARSCGFLMMGKNKDCQDVVLKLIEDSTKRLTQATGTTSPANIQKQLVELKDAQLVMKRAVLQIEDMLTAETKNILRYILREVYANFQALMSSLKSKEEENLLQVRRVQRESMFEIKHWLKQRFAMMADHDAKTTAILKSEIMLMIDKMEKLGNQRIMCIKQAFENNEGKIKAYNQEQDKTKNVQQEQFDHIKTIYHETLAELESKVNNCYGSIRGEAMSKFQDTEIQEQIKTNDTKTRVLEKFWSNVQEGEKEVVNELQNYCKEKEKEEAERTRDCIKGEEETMDLIRTDLVKKCYDIDRLELRHRTEAKKVEKSRIEEVKSLLKDNPWLWSEVRNEEEDRLLENRIQYEERLFELEARQDEAMTSLRASRDMTHSQIENKFKEKCRRLRKDFLTRGANYVVDASLIDMVRNIQEKVLLEIETIHKDMLNRIKKNDHRIFTDMETELQDTFERISSEYQKMFGSFRALQDGVYTPFQVLEEQIRKSNRVELTEEDVGDIIKEMRENLFNVLEVREKSHLVEWLETVSFNELGDALQKESITAQTIVKSLSQIEELRNEAISLDIRKMLKVLKKFQLPNRTVHEALKGVLLCLGDHEGFTGEWKNCMRRITPIGTTKLKWRLKKFIIKELDPRIAKRTIDILTEVPFDKVKEISPELLTYCEWAWAICEERLEMAMRSGLRTPVSADLNEQIQIFKRKYNSKGPVAGPRVLLFSVDETLSRHTDQMLELRQKKLFAYRDKQTVDSDNEFFRDT